MNELDLVLSPGMPYFTNGHRTAKISTCKDARKSGKSEIFYRFWELGRNPAKWFTPTELLWEHKNLPTKSVQLKDLT